MKRYLAGRGLLVAFAACSVVSVLPLLVTRVLPFHDHAGMVGLGGALTHLHDPAARIRALYDIDIRPYPSVLYFGWAWAAGLLGITSEVAFSAFLAIFAVLGTPLATVVLLRAFGRPPWLALLAFPVAYHHQVWFGFLGSAAAVTGLILALAFARLVVVAPTWRNHLGFASALLMVATAHPFPLAMTLAVVSPVLVWPTPGVQGVRPHALRFGARLACFVPTLVFLAGWSRTFFAGNAGNISVFSRIRREIRLRTPTPVEDARTFLEWLGNGYTARWDEWVPALALMCLAAFLIFGARAPSAPRDRGWLWLLWAALVLALGFLLLPMKLMWPNFWWGVRVRCVAPLFFVTIALVRARPTGLPAWATTPAVAVAMAFALFVTYDFRAHFRGRVLDGFDEAVALIPPGQSVMAFPVLPDRHYTEGHPYLVQHYVSRKGGRAVPQLKGHPGSYWITMKEPGSVPSWGDPAEFIWEEHAGGWDYFLLERPRGRPTPDPFRRAPAGAVERIFDRGNWVLWRRVPSP